MHLTLNASYHSTQCRKLRLGLLKIQRVKELFREGIQRARWEGVSRDPLSGSSEQEEVWLVCLPPFPLMVQGLQLVLSQYIFYFSRYLRIKLFWGYIGVHTPLLSSPLQNSSVFCSVQMWPFQPSYL